MKKSLTSLVDPDREWANAIGTAFVAFGSIEDTTVLCLRELPSEPIWRFARKLKLTPRINLLLELLEPHKQPECLKLVEALKQIRELAQTRNLLAHNPLILQTHDDGYGNRVFGAALTAIRKEGEIVTLSEAKEFAITCDRMAFELVGASINAFKALGLITYV